ncbi:MAG: ribosome biogenesis GTPase Der, partial [Calditrichia bacterium]
MKEWETDIRERLGTFNYVPLMFVSVLEKKRLYKLLDLVAAVNEEQHKKIRTSDLNKELLPVIEANSPPAAKGKEIKINYITQLKTAPPLIAFFCNHPDLIPENYRRFLEKQIRSRWGFKGVPVNLVFKAKRKAR